VSTVRKHANDGLERKTVTVSYDYILISPMTQDIARGVHRLHSAVQYSSVIKDPKQFITANTC
jgi:hypothetical protein